MSEVKKTNRLVVLDYLRGFFIIVIIVDHLSRWPSLFGYISGEALLWVTAAEGFVIISGFLVGYIRGNKSKLLTMKSVTIKLLKRALLLYLASVITTIIYTVIIWYGHFQGGTPGALIDKDDLDSLIIQPLILQKTFVWVYFLSLYSVFLTVSPIAIWLMRKGLAWLVLILSVISLTIGWVTENHLLQWQALFFLPSIAGFYLPAIISWWHKQQVTKRKVITRTIIGLAALSITASAILALPALADNALISWINNDLFDKENITIWRLLTALLWFSGFLFVFIKIKPWLDRWLSWLLLPFGTRSLSAYIIHGIAICFISYIAAVSDSIIINTLLDMLCISIVWILLKTTFVQKVIPH